MFKYIAMVLELYSLPTTKASVYGKYYCHVVATRDFERLESFLNGTFYSDKIS